MAIAPSFIVPPALHVDALSFVAGTVCIQATATGAAPRCPACGHPARRVHSTYPRTLADLPWAGIPVRWHVTVRRLRCDDPTCPRVVFAERLTDVAQRYARRTDRQRAALEAIGLELGGRAGARLAEPLGLATSRDTLLRLVRCLPLPAVDTPRVLGVDDWALCRGRTYGTILVDVADHHVVDLLPDRTADTLATWLAAHPGVEVLTRDGSQTYAAGATAGAPAAQQVADRFHLVANLRDALQQLLERHRAQLPRGPATDSEPADHPSAPVPAELGSYGRRSPGEERARTASREQRLARYQRVTELRALGWPVAQIATEVGLSLRTVARWVAAATFPERRPRRGSPSCLDAYKPTLDRRWQEGCHRVAQLCRELRALGYTGSNALVYQYAAQLRTGALAAAPRSDRPDAPPARDAPRRGPRGWAWLLLRAPEERSAAEQEEVARLEAAVADIKTAQALVQGFRRLLRERDGEAFDGWLAEARAGPPELRAFAAGLQRDQAAVRAAIVERWSNAVTEGKVTKLKLAKRQMYGRAGFDLLRIRVLRAA